MQQFFDREPELDFLERRLKSGKPELLLIYGRRRVGKTMLLLKLMESARGVYFLADERPQPENREALKQSMADFLQNDLFRRAHFDSWEEILREFAARLGEERVVLVIDEFPFLVGKDRALPSVIQKVWDTVLTEKPVMMILCGSSIGMMEELMGYRSPLYGRRTGQWQVMPMHIVQLKRFFPHYSPLDLMRTYATLDMIPFYLNQFDPQVDYFKNLEDRIFDKGSLLYLEAEFLLRQELREPTNYMAILKSLSLGNTRFSQIVNEAGLEKSLVSKYLAVLESLHMVERIYPAMERERKRKALYRLCDNYFGFWFRYVYPNRSLAEQGRGETILTLVKKDLDEYLGKPFERATAGMLWRWDGEGRLPLHLKDLGPWWRGEEEIDLVGTDHSSNIIFVECKWSDLDHRGARRLVDKLREKAGLVPWKKRARKQHFCLVARSVEGKEQLVDQGLLVFELGDFWDAGRQRGRR